MGQAVSFCAVHAGYAGTAQACPASTPAPAKAAKAAARPKAKVAIKVGLQAAAPATRRRLNGSTAKRHKPPLVGTPSAVPTLLCGLVGLNASYAAHGAVATVRAMEAVVDKVDGPKPMPCVGGPLKGLRRLNGADGAKSVPLVSGHRLYGTAPVPLPAVLPPSPIRPAIAAAGRVGRLAASAWAGVAARPPAKHIEARTLPRVLKACVAGARRNA